MEVADTQWWMFTGYLTKKNGLQHTCFLHCGHVLVEPIWNHCTRLEKTIHIKPPHSNITDVRASQLLWLKWGYHSWWKVCPQWMAATSLEWSKRSEQIVHCARIGILCCCRISTLQRRVCSNIPENINKVFTSSPCQNTTSETLICLCLRMAVGDITFFLYRPELQPHS